MSDSEKLAAVRRVLNAGRPAEETIGAIHRLLDPPRAPQPIERTDRGWPVLRGSNSPGAAWEWHDDPEVP